jgi:uncharacterized membrane protein YphA (DoxX/SURF4 family)
MELRDTQAVIPGRARDQQREGESFGPSAQTLEEVPWSTAHKIAFRFAFSYLVIYIFPFPFVPLWWASESRLGISESFWQRVVPWIGEHILHLSYPIAVFTSGGSDSTYDYVRVLCFVCIAASVTVIWSVMDRKRIAYSKLDQWIHLCVRAALAVAMFSYGFAKVIPVQMLPPGPSALIQPFGDLTPYNLLWSFMGASPAYEICCGVAEVLGGILLLTPGAAMAGALVSFAALANVFLLNMCYNIPVKCVSGHLMLLALFLLLPYSRRLVSFLVLNRPSEPPRSVPLFRRRWLNGAVWGVEWALGMYVIVLTLFVASSARSQFKSVPLTNPLYGIWRVDEFAADGQVRPPLLSDNMRWQRMIFDSEISTTSGVVWVVTIQEMNGQFSPYVAQTGTHGNTFALRTAEPNLYTSWTFTSAMDPRGQNRNAELSYNRTQPDTLILEGLMNGHQLRVTLKKEEREFVLETRGFRWINDDFYANFYNRKR